MAQTDLIENEKKILFEVDGFMLVGTLHYPDADNPPLVIGCHGLFADRSSPKQTALARAVCKKGMAFFRLDHRGCGESEGRFKEVTTLSARCRDLLGARDMLIEKFGIGRKTGLFGSSMGGAVCLSVALKTHVDCIVTNAAPVSFRPLTEVLKAQGQDSLLGKAFYEENPSLDASGAHPLTNILIFHGQKDETVPVSHAHRVYDMALEPRSLVIFENGDHRMSSTADQNEFINKATQWYLECLLKNR